MSEDNKQEIGGPWGPVRIAAIAGAMLLLSVPGARAATDTFARTTPISVTSTTAPPTRASPYPSTIFVPVAGTVTGARVTLESLNTPCPNDLDVALVAPSGRSVLFVSDAGGCVGAHGTFTFEDSASAAFANNGLMSPPSGTYHPTNNNPGTGTESFPAPGPGAGPFGANFSTLAGDNTTGYWELYVVDDEGVNGNTSTIAGGWNLELTYTPPPPPSTPPTSTSTGLQAAALKQCKNRAQKHNWSKERLKKCKKKARLLPV
jgi:subtilisin-like proprotein convertase family protein